MDNGDVNYFLGVVDKLDEASFFCDHVRRERDAFNIGHYVNAFAGACYGAWQCLELLCRPEPVPSEPCANCGATRRDYPEGDKAWSWFRHVRRTAKNSPVARYFHQGRNTDVHEGVGFIDTWSMTLTEVAGELKDETLAQLRDARVRGFPEERRPTEACEDYLAGLVRIAAAGYGEFHQTWDASGDLKNDVERLQRRWAGNAQ